MVISNVMKLFQEVRGLDIVSIFMALVLIAKLRLIVFAF